MPELLSIFLGKEAKPLDLRRRGVAQTAERRGFGLL